MTCEDCREILSIYIDEELPASERAEIERHLAECSECAAELERLTEMMAQLRETSQREMPVDAAARLDDAISAALRERQAASVPSPGRGPEVEPWWRWFLRPAFGGVAASMAVLVFAVVVWSGAPERMRSGQGMLESAPNKSDSLVPKAAERLREKSLSVDVEDEADAGSVLMAPQALKEDDNAFPATFTQADLAFLSRPDLSKKERDTFEPVEAAADSDQKLLFDTYVSPRTGIIEAQRAAQIVAGDEQAELLFAQAGLFEVGTGVQEAWIIVIELKETPGVPVAAAVSLVGGEVLYRTD